jgi:phosphoribosylformylglycinamidine synthase subunit PurSL
MPTAAPYAAARVHRIQVWSRSAEQDPRAQSLRHDAAAIGVELAGVRTARIYLIEGVLNDEQLRLVQERLLTDPVVEVSLIGAPPPTSASADQSPAVVEVHPLPGVMDPVAQSVQQAIHDLVGVECTVSTGRRYELAGATPEQAQTIARRLLANPVIHSIHAGPFHPEQLPHGREYQFHLRHIPILQLDDAALVRLSREAHLFLSLDEMRAIQDEYRRIGRDPTDIELETLAQTWSEHCVHKTLKSTITYRREGGPAAVDPIDWRNRPGHTINPDGSITINNLLKSTVAAATYELIDDGVDWALSVFKDNAGIIAFDEHTAVCIKVETHNHPSAIEPYGGAATGAGGCIRDIIGTGLAAKPIANTDVFCVAFPERWGEWQSGKVAEWQGAQQPAMPLPPGTLHPRRILTDVVAGVRDYGNRMGIPTLSGAVYFDDRYIGNPLVFCGCIGVMPRHLIRGQARPGDRIIALGGRTGRDGIHGATFSSAELEHTAAEEFSHAVQIGNAIEEKRLLDAILRARDYGRENGEEPGALAAGVPGMPLSEDQQIAPGAGPLFSAITDCGAGGFSSAVGEMGAKLGAEVHLERAPLKYAGLSYTEIWISEAQERMILAVPPGNVEALRRICAEEHVEMADLGHFGTPDAQLILDYHQHEVGRMSMHFIHEGIPQPTREATWPPTTSARAPSASAGSAPATSSSAPLSTATHTAIAPAPLAPSIPSSLRALLSHPNIASKHWIIRQYDHEVQGNTIIKPLVGPHFRGPSDASVIEPVPRGPRHSVPSLLGSLDTTSRALAIAGGLQTAIGDPAIGGDPYLMALAAIDECVRNLVCTGADPGRIAILDNFCWPSCARPENLGSLVRAAEGCYDGAKAYRTPFVSGKDSLNNQLRYIDPRTGEERLIEIPPTLLITGIGIVPALERCTTMDAKRPGNIVVLVGVTDSAMAGSHYASMFGLSGEARDRVPATNLELGPRTARAVAAAIAEGIIAAAHDASDGGVLCALAEMLIAAPEGTGALIDLAPVHADVAVAAFSESPSRYLLELAPADLPRLHELLEGIPHQPLGQLNTTGRLTWQEAGLDAEVRELTEAWLGTLDW